LLLTAEFAFLAFRSPYYECSSKVQSELCVPILRSDGTVIGIIDAESWQKNAFTPQVTAEIVKVCEDLGKFFPN